MLYKSLSALLLFVVVSSSSFASANECGHLYAGQTSVLCPGDTVLLRVTSASDAWHWRDGVSSNWLGDDSTLVVTQPGLYIAALDNGCAAEYIWVWTMAEIEANLPVADTFCSGRPYQLSLLPPMSNTSILWWDGNTSMYREFSEAGEYSYTITSNCGTITKTLTLSQYPEPIGNFPEETLLCQNDSVELSLPVTGALWQRWSTGSYDSSIVVSDTGTYSVQLGMPNFCMYTYEAKVVFDDCLSPETNETEGCSVIVPNVFTPNGDGHNDAFQLIQLDCKFKSYRLDIYDRWGRPCFISENPEDKWRGGNHAAGIYYWRVSYHTDDANTRPVQEAGALLLMR